MPQRLKYPDAASKRDHYEEAERMLENYKSTIETSLSNAKINSSNYNESTVLEGDYYDTYKIKKNDWITQHNQLIADFDIFLNYDIKTCIDNAKNLKDLWASRIGEMEDY